MRILIAIALTAALGLLGSRQLAVAQWTSNKTEVSGMFGPRQLGETFKPKPSTLFSGSFLRGPGGSFVGRNPAQPSALFRTPYPPYYDYSSLPPAQPQVIPVMPSEAPVAGQREQQPELQPQPLRQPGLPPEAPQMWFRGERPMGTSGGLAPGAESATAPAAWQGAAAEFRRGPAIGLGGVIPSGEGQTANGSSALTGMPLGVGGVGSVDQLLSSSLESQIASIPRFQKGGPIRVSVAGGVATLQGSVATQHDRKVLAEFVRMEPGVWKVNNEVTVKP